MPTKKELEEENARLTEELKAKEEAEQAPDPEPDPMPTNEMTEVPPVDPSNEAPNYGPRGFVVEPGEEPA